MGDKVTRQKSNFTQVKRLRQQTLKVARNYMHRDLGWTDRHIIDMLSYAASPDTCWVEFAHTPQLPHLGIARLILTAAQEAASCSGVLLYCVNDHLPPRDLPESRYMPFYNEHGRVAKSPRFGPPKAQAKWAMSHLPAPDISILEDFQQRWITLAHGQSTAAVRRVSQAMISAAEECTSFAAWLTRVTFDALDLKPIVLPTSRLEVALPEQIETLHAHSFIHGWSDCQKCGYRLGRWPVALEHCSCCKTPISDNGDFHPDVIGRQAVVNNLDLDLRVCGRSKPYQQQADELTYVLLRRSAPPRLHVTGLSRMMFLPHQEEGEARFNLFQALTILPEGEIITNSLPEPTSDWKLYVRK